MTKPNDMAGWGHNPDGKTWVLLGERPDGVRPYVEPLADGSVKLTLDSNGPTLECTLTAQQWAALCRIVPPPRRRMGAP